MDAYFIHEIGEEKYWQQLPLREPSQTRNLAAPSFLVSDSPPLHILHLALFELVRAVPYNSQHAQDSSEDGSRESTFSLGRPAKRLRKRTPSISNSMSKTITLHEQIK
jgi:hypothetical protein